MNEHTNLNLLKLGFVVTFLVGAAFLGSCVARADDVPIEERARNAVETIGMITVSVDECKFIVKEPYTTQALRVYSAIAGLDSKAEVVAVMTEGVKVVDTVVAARGWDHFCAFTREMFPEFVQ